MAPAAKAGGPPTPTGSFSLFGDIFERVRADYVEKPDDNKLVEFAIKRHAVRARSALQLHGCQELPRHAVRKCLASSVDSDLRSAWRTA